MTLAIMQPYLFPYIGYWQLINAVDTFVIYDDVNYINKGYDEKTGMHFYQYNERTSVVEEKDGAGLIPNISYKIYF